MVGKTLHHAPWWLVQPVVRGAVHDGRVRVQGGSEPLSECVRHGVFCGVHEVKPGLGLQKWVLKRVTEERGGWRRGRGAGHKTGEREHLPAEERGCRRRLVQFLLHFLCLQMEKRDKDIVVLSFMLFICRASATSTEQSCPLSHD